MPTAGQAITADDFNSAIGNAAGTALSLNNATIRTLADKITDSTQISYDDGHRVTLDITLGATNMLNADLTAQAGYKKNRTDVILRIPAGVAIGGGYPYTDQISGYGTQVPAITINGNAYDTITIYNSGFIIGVGGYGDHGNDFAGRNTVSPGSSSGYNGGIGGTAITTNIKTTIYNNGTIAGGGGGGGGSGGAWWSNGTMYGGSGGGGGAGIPAGPGGDRGRNSFYRLYYGAQASYPGVYLNYQDGNNGYDGSPGTYSISNNTLTQAPGAGGLAISSSYCGDAAQGGYLGAQSTTINLGYPMGGAGSISGVKPSTFLDYAMNFTGQIGSFNGSGGYYIKGNNKVTWAVTGTRLGLASATQ